MLKSHQWATSLVAISVSLCASCKTVRTNSEGKAIIGNDDRSASSDAAYEQTVGSILFEVGETTAARCTAALIGQSTILTASHCVDNKQLGQYKFVLKGQKPVSILKVKEFYPNANVVVLTVDLNSTHFFETAALDRSAEGKIVSYDVGSASLLEDAGSKFGEQQGQGVVLHSFDTVASASGSPLIQNNKIVAVHVGALYDKELRLDLSEYSKDIDEAFAYIASDRPKAEALLAKFPKESSSAVLVGNIAVEFTTRATASIRNIENRLSFESLLPGAVDVIIPTISAFEFGKKTAPVIPWTTATKTMLLKAATLGVNRAYKNDIMMQCAIRNTSAAAKKVANEIPPKNGKFYTFINRPSLGAEQRILVLLHNLNPKEYPCSATGDFVGGLATVNYYYTVSAAGGIYHMFDLGVNSGCANSMNTQTDLWAGVIAHEMLHNLNQRHDGTSTALSYKGRLVGEFGNCVEFGDTYDVNKLSLTGLKTRRMVN